MSNADRIEELRAKYEENPRRYFAPLANEFRKAGDLAQAIAICREHLPKQPGHMSGYIVFGQTLFEANSLEEARSVFEQALTLDPENLIALKHLGDIARMNGENSVARRWYARVLDADPRNDDIALQLASLGAPTPAVPVPVVPPPAPEPEPLLEEKPGVFATFDPSSLLDVPDDVVSITSASVHSTESEPAHEASTSAIPVETPSFEAADELPSPDTIDTPQAPAYLETAYAEPAGHATANNAPANHAPANHAATTTDPIEPEVDFAGASVAETADQRQEPAARLQASHEPLDLDFPDDPEPPAGEEFEEGILAPQWPDTSSLVARIVTPLRSATPISVPATAEAVAAFGRESGDPVEPIDLDLPVRDELVDAFLPAEAPTPSVAATMSGEDVDEVTDLPPEEPAEQASTPQPTSFLAELQAAEFEAVEFDGNVAEPLEFESVVDEVTQEIPVTAQQTEVADVEQVDPLDVSGEASLPWELVDEAADIAPGDSVGVEAAAAVEPLFENAIDTAAIDNAIAESAFDPDATAEFPIPAVWSSEITSEPVGEHAEEIPEESFATISSELAQDAAEHDLAAHDLTAETATADETAVVPTEPTPVSAESEKAQPFVTETMAELLLSQGFVSRAIDVYGELVKRRPFDEVLTSRLAELRALEQEELRRADELIAMEASLETPAIASTPITPLYSTPVRNTPIFTPQSVVASAPFTTPGGAATALRTARDQFAALAARRVARRTPAHATAVSDDQADGLSSLFGTTQPATTDELAARALAEAFGPVQDSGESLFDPAPIPTPTVPLRALTPRHATPIHTPSQSNPDHRSDRQPTSDYSFDKFFPDPAIANRGATPAHSAATATQDTSLPVNEDLAQFSAWLKGLNNA